MVCLLFLLGMGIEGKEEKKDDELPFLANIFFNLSYHQLYFFQIKHAHFHTEHILTEDMRSVHLLS